MSYLNLLTLMASLDILCFNPFIFNLKNKIFKIEQKKIFRGPSKILKSISWPINICLKYFMAPTKTIRPPPPPPPPTYLLLQKLRSLNWKNHMKSSKIKFLKTLDFFTELVIYLPFTYLISKTF